MAYPAMAKHDVTPVFDMIMSQHLLESNLFAFYFSSQVDQDIKGQKSDLTLGYYDKSKFIGELAWHDIKMKFMFGV